MSQKTIKDVAVGDKVLATDPKIGETAARPVTELIRRSGKHTMVDVHLADGTTITATDWRLVELEGEARPHAAVLIRWHRVQAKRTRRRWLSRLRKP